MLKWEKTAAWIVAAVLCVSILGGCGSEKTNSEAGDDLSKEVTLSWYMPNGNREDDAVVFEKASEYVKDKINANLKIINVDGGNYDNKMQVICASNDEFDVCFTSNWLFNYYNNIDKGAFIELDELLPKYAPQLYASMDERIWDGVRVNGKIYGVINQQIMARAPVAVFPEKNIAALGFDPTTVHKLEDLEPYLKLVKEATGEPNEAYNTWMHYAPVAGIEEFMGSGLPAGIYYNDPDTKVFNQYESPEFKQYIETYRKWHNEGLVNENVVVESEELDRRIKQNSKEPVAHIDAVSINPTYKPGMEQEFIRERGQNPVYQHLAEPLLTSSAVTSTLNSISATSQNPERAMMMLELVNTDKYLYNLLVHGIEDLNYVKTGENRFEQIEGHEYITSDWVIGNVFNGMIEGNAADDIWEQTKQLNDSAKISPLYGFSPDLSKISLQVSNCKSVTNEYLNSLEQGVVDIDEIYPIFIEKLNAAGANEIVNEMQRQIDEWKASKES